MNNNKMYKLTDEISHHVQSPWRCKKGMEKDQGILAQEERR